MTNKNDSPTANRRAREKERRRASILHSALDLIRTQGLHHLQMDDLARQTELAKGTLYRYFKSKDAVLVALIIQARLALLQRFKIATTQKETPLQQVEAIYWCNFEFCQEHQDLYELMFFYEFGILDETLLDDLKPSSKAIVDFLVSIIQKGLEEKVLRPEINPLEFSFNMYGTTMGMLKMLSVHASMLQKNLHQSVEEVFRTFVERTIRSIQA